jgi:uncharacterized protein (DUF2141 family)
MKIKPFTMTALCMIALAGCQQRQANQETNLNVNPNTLLMVDDTIQLQDSVKDETAKAENPEDLNLLHSIPLTVIVDNLKSPEAPIEMSIYGPENKFPSKDGQLKKYRFRPQQGKLIAKINDLSYGEFALALYQDVDSDGEIDKNGLGIPTEPYAFSNNFRPVIKAPSFKDCKFVYDATTNTLNIALLK